MSFIWVDRRRVRLSFTLAVAEMTVSSAVHPLMYMKRIVRFGPHEYEVYPEIYTHVNVRS